MIWLVLGAVAIAVTGVMLAGGLRRRVASAKAAIAAAAPIKRSPANSFGLESSGPAHVRGNGVLAMTGDALRFEQYVPRRSLAIPLRSVVEVTTVRSFLGRRTVRDLIVVRWRLADGTADRAAWAVTDAAGWLDAIGSV